MCATGRPRFRRDCALVFYPVGMQLSEAVLDALMMPGDLPEVASVLQSPPWMRRAACRDPVEGVTWFPERGLGQPDAKAQAQAAKAVCDRCPVQRQCLDYALADDSLCGVWGGTTDGERTRMRREMRRAAA